MSSCRRGMELGPLVGICIRDVQRIARRGDLVVNQALQKTVIYAVLIIVGVCLPVPDFLDGHYGIQRSQGHL